MSALMFVTYVVNPLSRKLHCLFTVVLTQIIFHLNALFVI
nr:unnamed protein product [Callosobruchus chinensis]